MPEKKRIHYLDIAKGLGILLVIVGHSHCPKELRNFIYLFHMPFFFFLSGYLLTRKRRFIEFLIGRIRYLLIPYFMFAALSISFTFILSRHYGNQFDLTNAVINVLKMSVNVRADLESIYNGPLWFLPCLFYANILGYMIISIRNDLAMVLSVTVLSISSLLLTKYTSIGFGPFIALFFLTAGYQVKKHKLLEKISSLRLLPNLAITTVLLLAVALVGIFGGNISMSNVDFVNFYWFFIGGTFGSMAIMISAKVIGSSQWLEYLGKNAIIIFGFHSLAQKAIDILRILFQINVYNMYGRNVYLFVIIWDLIICSLVAALISRTVFLRPLFYRKY